MPKNIELVTRYEKKVDERFSAESKRDLITNQDYSWDGAKTIKVYKINTAQMNDYNRDGDLNSGDWSRYGKVQPLDAVTETLMIERDRSFTFALDRIDIDETGDALEVNNAIARQTREVIIPEYDEYIYKKVADNSGTVVNNILDKDNIYQSILDANAVLDENFVPETERVLLLTPETYKILKESEYISSSSEIGQDLRIKGVVNVIDGVLVVKVPTIRLPKDLGFILLHKSAVVAPVKLEDIVIHDNPPGFNGTLVEGRFYYDCFILDNKKKAIYTCYNKNT